MLRSSQSPTLRWANKVPRTPTYMMSGWTNLEIGGWIIKTSWQRILLPLEKQVFPASLDFSFLFYFFNAAILSIPTRCQARYVRPVILARSQAAAALSLPQGEGNGLLCCWSRGWVHTEGRPSQQPGSPRLRGGLWPSAQPEARAMRWFFHSSKTTDLVCHKYGPRWWIVLTGDGTNEWTMAKKLNVSKFLTAKTPYQMDRQCLSCVLKYNLPLLQMV